MHASLATIGRLQPVESDDPPGGGAPPRAQHFLGPLFTTTNLDEDDFPDADVLPSSSGVPSSHSSGNSFRGRYFGTLGPEDMREIAEQGDRRFVFTFEHETSVWKDPRGLSCRHNEAVRRAGTSLLTVVRLEERLQRVEVKRQIASRLQDFEELAGQVDRLIVQEVRLWETSKLEGSPGVHTSGLGYLRGLCESLRLCINQAWTLTIAVQQNPLVQRNYSSIRHLMDYFLTRHHSLAAQTVLATRHLIQTGLLVLSYSDLTRYTHDDLWEISRGIEEFNTILDDLQQQRRRRYQQALHRRQGLSTRMPFSFTVCERDVDQVDLVRPVSFSKILYRLASERSVQIVGGVHNFFHASRALVEMVTNERSALLCLIAPASSMLADLSDDDAKSDETATDWSEPCSVLLEKAVDRLLSGEQCPPLNDALRVEYEFASGFLDIISQSTEMLKDLQDPSRHRMKRLQKAETLDNFMAPPPASPPTSLNSPATLKPPPGNARPTEIKKGVQWSDHKEVRVRHYVIGRYLELVWQHVGTQLMTSLVQCTRCASSTTSSCSQSRRQGGSCSGCRGEGGGECSLCDCRTEHCSLGSNLLFPAHVHLLIARLMVDPAIKDLFPPGLIPILRGQSWNVKMNAMISIYDQGVMRLHNSGRQDGLTPCHLAAPKGPHCTILCRHLMVTMAPIVDCIQGLVNQIEMHQGVASKCLSNDRITTLSILTWMISMLHSLITCYLTTLGLPHSPLSNSRHRWNRPNSKLYMVLYADLPLIGSLISQLTNRIMQLRFLFPYGKEDALLAGKSVEEESTFVQLREAITNLDKMKHNIQILQDCLTHDFVDRCNLKSRQLFVDLLPSTRSSYPRPFNPPSYTRCHSLSPGPRHPATNGGATISPTPPKRPPPPNFAARVFHPAPALASQDVYAKLSVQSASPRTSSSNQSEALAKNHVTPMANEYARAVVSALLTDVVSAVARLPPSNQIAAIHPAVDSICIAWQDHVLHTDIKFDHSEACQLETDVQVLPEWISQFISSPEVRSHLLALPSLTALTAGIHLLKTSLPCPTTPFTLNPSSTDALSTVNALHRRLSRSLSPSPLPASSSNLPVNHHNLTATSPGLSPPSALPPDTSIHLSNAQEWLNMRQLGPVNDITHKTSPSASPVLPKPDLFKSLTLNASDILI